MEVLLAEHERVGEVFLAHNLVLCQFLRRALEEDAPLEEQIGTVRDTERILHVVVSDEDADISVLQFPHDELDILHGDGVDARKGLVEHDELRLDGQATGDLRPSALTARQLVTLVLAHLAQTELLDQILQFLQLVVARLARHLEHREDIVLDTHLTEHARLLRQIADASTRTLIHRVVRHLLVAQVDMPSVGHDQTRGHIERGGLAGTVRAQQTHDLTLLHVETHVVHHRTFTIPFHETFRPQHQPLLLLILFHIGCKITKKTVNYRQQRSSFYFFSHTYQISMRFSGLTNPLPPVMPKRR